ncbi:MAG: sigma-70 family RNA polymerase sigma factor [Chitinophagaceae bacterium]|nr:sigma-70 family RNA polymerase sigma factor [Chitinophagaceae bacterium]MBK7123923.1 sigma-70 family RNA polymerase sigma factor [Chitinophagaceae bacterium]MBK9533406.1 sigma-70 family RNA polymerase sigma factor [Chitinophagaceae bacterium]HQW92178.1 sigma-70 family RNA polymerase sigma factor [Ferruginibacter sp.]
MAFIKNISSDQSPDKELLIAFKQTGNINLLSTLYQRYMDLVFGVCLKYFKDAERSKDAVMDIFDELNTKLRVHEVENFKSWLHVLARNHCLMQLRSPRNIKTTEFNPVFMYSEQNTHLNGEVLEKEENFKKLEQCMDSLPDEQKQAVQLFYLESKCYNEIAAITGFDWNKVRSYIQNGKRNLKLCMEEKQLRTDEQR